MKTKTILSAFVAISVFFAESLVPAYADEPEKTEIPPIKKEQGTNDPIENDGFYVILLVDTVDGKVLANASGYYFRGDEVILRTRSAQEYVLLIPLSHPDAISRILEELTD